MIRLRLAILVALAAVAFAAMPSAAFARTGADTMRTLGATSPLCRGASVDAKAQANCRASGSLEHPYPLDHYGLDSHVNTSVWHPLDDFLAAIQSVLGFVWTIALWVLQGIMLLFQWAFSLDLLSKTMSGAAQAMNTLHDQVLGQPWFLAALSVLGIWAIFRGFVQGKKIETVAGLGLAVLMMALALFIIARPTDTIGGLSRGANDVSLAFLAGASQGTISHPQTAISQSSEQIFNSIALRPWCALEFADVTWCLSHEGGDPLTHADRYLRYAVGSDQRNAEYDAIQNRNAIGSYHPTAADVGKADMQGKGRTGERIALLVLVLIGQAGCMLLLGYLSFKVLLQGLMVLFYLLLTPVMLFAPAFGDQGRELFKKWGLRFLSALLSKAIYALLLAVLLAIATMIASLDNVFSFWVVWLLEIVFWWGIIIKRKEIFGFLSFGGGHGTSAADLYYKAQNAKAGVQAVGSFADATAGRAIGRARDTIAGRRDHNQAEHEAHADAVRSGSLDQLKDRARQKLDHDYADAHQRVAAHDDAKDKIARLSRGELRDYDRRRAKGDVGKLSPDEQRALAQRRALEKKLMASADYGVARRFIETADRNQVEQGRRWSDKQLDLAVEGLRNDVESGAGAGDQVHAWRAGMPRAELEKLSPEARKDLHGRITDDLARDRVFLSAHPAAQDAAPKREHVRQAEKLLDPDLIKERRTEQLRQRQETRLGEQLRRRELDRDVHRGRRRRRR